MPMTVVKSSVLPAGIDAVWEKLQSLEALQYVASPYASFEPEDSAAPLIWRRGETYRLAFRLFTIIPLGIHTIKIVRLDPGAREICSHENNRFVPVWNHRIQLTSAADGKTFYTDEVTIDAGLMTPLVYLWAKCFYAHRQRKWAGLLRTRP